jgi:hypothetical protein
MTILRYFFFKMLFEKIAFLLISLNQRYSSRKCPDNKLMHFGLSFLYKNQLVKRYQNAPDNILQGRPDNNYYEAERPHN